METVVVSASGFFPSALFLLCATPFPEPSVCACVGEFHLVQLFNLVVRDHCACVAFDSFTTASSSGFKVRFDFVTAFVI
jgi:hypothetical protein